MDFDFSVEDHSAEVIAEMLEKKRLALEEIGLVAEGYAKRLCPVDTGRLRNSITHTHDDEAAYIGTNVEYAPYVEFGTRRQTAQPFLRPAAEEHSNEYSYIVENIMRGG